MGMAELCGKRFLITQCALDGIAGSEVTTLHLAEYLQQAGATVTVFTHWLGNVLGQLFAQSKITVIADKAHPFALEDFDYIWVHHQVLPAAILRALAHPPANPPVFLFLHMSALPGNHLEWPYICGLEELLSSLSLCNSPVTLERLAPCFSTPPPMAVYPNPVPPEFCRPHRNLRQLPHKPLRVMVVSNNDSPERDEACALLRQHGVQAERFGIGQRNYKLLRAADLDRYDAIITIGKTVQYCLCMGLPVYIYDRFGGPGWLNARNFDLVAAHNFSGRGPLGGGGGGGHKKTPPAPAGKCGTVMPRRRRFTGEAGSDSGRPMP
ncbi:MAG: glycosyltransferase, partial [Oscillospiraceae bacterium]|nr:glycosyltransferase [Oscillospiraceae bacterium]